MNRRHYAYEGFAFPSNIYKASCNLDSLSIGRTLKFKTTRLQPLEDSSRVVFLRNGLKLCQFLVSLARNYVLIRPSIVEVNVFGVHISVLRLSLGSLHEIQCSLAQLIVFRRIIPDHIE